MHIIDIIGYIAAALMFSTFYMRRMIPLRAVGIASNCTFIIYAGISHVYPLLVLHMALLPLNIIRMVQMIKLINKVREASRGELSLDFLVPFMTKERFNKNDIIFKNGDVADRMYFMRKGLARVVEVDAYIKEGELFGEMGVFSRINKRTATVICETPSEVLSIPEKQVLQLYYQNPTFGLNLVQLMVQRFLRNAGNIDHAGTVVPSREEQQIELTSLADQVSINE